MIRFLEAMRRLFRRAAQFRPVRQPQDWSDREGWDAYWLAMIQNDQERTDLAGAFWRDPFISRYLPQMRERDLRRVLYAGNGISLEPHALVHCGFDVTAVDLSPLACDFVREYCLTPAQLSAFLPAYQESIDSAGFRMQTFDPEASAQRVRDEYRPGGRLEVLAEDLLSWSPPHPFDVIYAERSVQGFPDEARRELARRYFAWLSPGGILVASTVRASEELERRLYADFQAAGFFRHLEETTTWYRTHPWPTTEEGRERLLDEQAERAEAERARERARLEAGEKLLVLWNSLS